MGGRLLRFSMVGAGNTALTTLLLILLTFVLDVRIAYAIAYGVGLCFATWASAGFVFGSRLTPRRTVVFCGWYLAVFAVGLVVVHHLETKTGLPEPAVAMGAVLVTAPINYLGGHMIFPTEGAPRKTPSIKERS